MTAGHILLVEDNPDDADLSVAVLKHHFGEVEVATAADGVEAMEYLMASGAQAGSRDSLPNFVLLDLKLPRMDGHDVLRAIRADPRLMHLPVVILTSSIEDHDIRNSYALGANSYVRKPVDFDDFSRLAERLGRYWLELNRVAPAVQQSPQ